MSLFITVAKEAITHTYFGKQIQLHYYVLIDLFLK